MSPDERRLLGLLHERSFRRGEFRLASGGISPYYIDVRTTSVCSEGAHLIGEVLYGRLEGLDVGAIGGPQVGSIPLTTAAVSSFHRHGRSMGGFWVRDEAKGHGTRSLIEGGLRDGTRVVVVDDVVTSGKSVILAVRAVREIGCRVVAVLALVDRLYGADELFRRAGIDDYRRVFTIKDFGVDGDFRGHERSHHASGRRDPSRSPEA